MRKILQNILFLFQFSWKVGRSRFFFAPVNVLIRSVMPFVFLILPKYIIDELAGEKRWDVVLQYIVILIAVTAAARLLNWGIWFFSKRSASKCNMENEKMYLRHFLYMDYANLENSDIKDLGTKVANTVNAVNFIDNIVCGFLVNLFQLIGYTYIIVQLHPLIILIILIIIKVNAVIAKKREEINY